jgi:hypothetical protein
MSALLAQSRHVTHCYECPLSAFDPKRTFGGSNVRPLHRVSLNRCIWGRVCGGASSSGYLAVRRCCRSGARATAGADSTHRRANAVCERQSGRAGTIAAFIRELQQLGWTDGRNVLEVKRSRARSQRTHGAARQYHLRHKPGPMSNSTNCDSAA